MRRIGCLALLWLCLLVGSGRADDPPAVVAAADKAAMQARIAAAAAEGALVYWDAVISPETSEELATGFRAYYGLPASFAVRFTQSATLSLVTRVEQEVNSGNVTIDVASLASPPWINGLVAGGHVMTYESPEHAHYTQAFAAGLGRPGLYAPNGAYMFIPAWNADSLSYNGRTWKDVLGAVPQGRISLNDSANSATGLLTYMGLRTILGLDFFRSLARMKPALIVRSEQTAERLLTGQDLLAFGGVTGRLFQANERGGNLKFQIPQDGVVLLGAGSFILAKAPHPAAARLWIDWTLSEKGQTILAEREALISGRSGFISPLPEYAPTIESLPLVKMDWTKITQDDIRKAKAEWQSIFTP